MAFHTHGEHDLVCDLPSKKACDDRYADWQAMQQVILAARIARGDRAAMFSGRRGDKSIIGQLVRLMLDEQEDIMNEDGNPSEAPWAKRLRAAMARVRDEGLPMYNLYTWPETPAEQSQ